MFEVLSPTSGRLPGIIKVRKIRILPVVALSKLQAGDGVTSIAVRHIAPRPVDSHEKVIDPPIAALGAGDWITHERGRAE